LDEIAKKCSSFERRSLSQLNLAVFVAIRTDSSCRGWSDFLVADSDSFARNDMIDSQNRLHPDQTAK